MKKFKCKICSKPTTELTGICKDCYDKTPGFVISKLIKKPNTPIESKSNDDIYLEALSSISGIADLVTSGELTEKVGFRKIRDILLKVFAEVERDV